MKFIVSSAELLKRLSNINGVITTNPVVPILENFLFEIKDGLLTIHASDLQTTMITEIDVEDKEDGNIAVRGEYKFDHRVGKWQEFYDGRRLKREVIYSEDPFDFEFNPYILKEWDRNGKLIFDHKRSASSKR